MTHHAHTRPEDKIAPSRYAYAVTLINKLREDFSVKEVSRIAQGNSEMHGWADTALRLRGVVQEHHIRNMEDYLRPKTAKKNRGIQPGDHGLTPDQQKVYRKLVLRLREIHGWDNNKIAAAIGLASGNQVSQILANGKGTLSRLQAAQQISDALEKAAAAAREASELNGHPDPEDRRLLVESAAAQEEARFAAPAVREPAPAAAAAPRTATEDADPVRAAQRAGAEFLQALAAMQNALPKFAQAAAHDLHRRAAAIVAELGEEGE